MYRNVFMMLATIVVAILALLVIGWLSYGWAYGVDDTLGGHLGFLAPIVLGACLFGLGVVYGWNDGNAEADAAEMAFEAYHEGLMEERMRQIAITRELRHGNA